MNTKHLERFAQSARRQLHEEVAARLARVLRTDSAELRAKAQMIQALKDEITATSRDAVVERVAYTWFNRFIALRYMDVSGITRVGTVSPAVGPSGVAFSQPELLQEAKQGIIDDEIARFADARQVFGLLDGRLPSGDPQQEAYRLLLIAVCNAYHEPMPFMFEKIDDYSELLMPDDLLSESSILQAVRDTLTPETCKDVEVIGWLYQYYISEKKDAVMARKGAVPPEDIPAVTQLFTPHWIVRYMVENTLGRLWMVNRPESRLVERMAYYIAPEEGEVTSDASRVNGTYPVINSPEEIRICDPACGSGHILTYAFDLLYAIYEEAGYDPVAIPRLILDKNLTGIEIDPRAGALAGFALIMKARERDRRFLRRGVQPDICVMQDVAFTSQELNAYMDAVGRDLFTQDVRDWLQQFGQATTFGSLIRPLVTDTSLIHQRLGEAGVFQDLFLSQTHGRVRAALRMTEALLTRYHVAVANPPYMGGRGMTRQLKDFARGQYPDSKSDLCTMFVERNLELVMPKGIVGMITMMSWMFLSSFKKLRTRILDQETIETMAHLGARAFDTIGGVVVSTTAFTLRREASPAYRGSYLRLVDGNSETEKARMLVDALQTGHQDLPTSRYSASAADFKKIPGAPIAYWVSDRVRKVFQRGTRLGDIAQPRQGLATADNKRFVRLWSEVSSDHLALNCADRRESLASGARWFPYNKGGPFRRWYGNQEHVVNWENDGNELVEFRPRSVIRSPDTYFQQSLSWSKVSSGSFALRHFPPGFIYDVAGCSIFFSSDSDREAVLGAMNSPVMTATIAALAPTLNFEVGQIANFPVVEIEGKDAATHIVDTLIGLSRTDWNSYETSWSFGTSALLHAKDGFDLEVEDPLSLGGGSGSWLHSTYTLLRSRWQRTTGEMRGLEEASNQFFIAAYDLQGELSPKAPLREVSLTCNPHYRYGGSHLDASAWVALSERFPDTCQTLDAIAADMAPEMPEDKRLGLEQRLLDDTMRELMSYAVGCMLGRYSLDKPGLILANQGETVEDYIRKVSGRAQERRSVTSGQEITFMPDEDNVIPILDGDWFADDISERFKQFLRVTFGDEHYEENLAFLELAIGRDIRNYFVRDFYKDHVKMYKKRPIYWLFSSPRGSFSVLIYMHRYQPDTVSIVLNDYLREFRAKLSARRDHLDGVSISADASRRDKTQALKEIARIDKVLNELRDYEDEVLYPLAAQRIEIDLDDGVLVNYNKFGKALKPVKGLSGKA